MPRYHKPRYDRLNMQTYRLSYIINIFLVIVESALSIRFLLKFFGANIAAPFTQWVYSNTEPLLSPFVNIFPAPKFQGNFTVEFTSLVAMLIYLLIGYAIIEVLDLATMATQRRQPKK